MCVAGVTDFVWGGVPGTSAAGVVLGGGVHASRGAGARGRGRRVVSSGVPRAGAVPEDRVLGHLLRHLLVTPAPAAHGWVGRPVLVLLLLLLLMRDVERHGRCERLTDGVVELRRRGSSGGGGGARLVGRGRRREHLRPERREGNPQLHVTRWCRLVVMVVVVVMVMQPLPGQPVQRGWWRRGVVGLLNVVRNIVIHIGAS